MSSKVLTVPFKANAAQRHHILKQRHRATNSAAYDAALRQRGSLTVWFADEAIAAWKAEPRTTRGGQPRYSALAIATALTLWAVFRLALRQTEGLIGSILALLGLDLAVPDHSTLSRRAETLALPPAQHGSAPVHLLVDSTGLKLCGAGEWLLEKHGTRTRRSWRKLHVGVDADTGRIVAATLTTSDVDDASQVSALLDQAGPLASFTADGAYDQDGVYDEVARRSPGTAVIVPPRSSAVPSETAGTAPTQRDRHLQMISERGRRHWQKASGYHWRALVEADISRFKRVIGDGLRSRTDRRRGTEIALAVGALNQMLELGRRDCRNFRVWAGMMGEETPMARRKAPYIPDQLLDQLLAGADPRTAFDPNGLLDGLKKALAERVLNAEMDHHLANEPGNSRNGHGAKTVLTDTGRIDLAIPRDRQASFDPQLIAKYQRRFPGFDDKIVSMYARGMSTREIAGHLRDLYGVEVSADLISAVTDAVLEEVAAWQARPLEPVYPLVFFDALRVKIRDEGLVRNKAVHVALGVRADGTKEVLGLWLEQNEGAKF